MFWQIIINGLITGLLYSLLAIGFALVYNTTHIFHIAAASIYVFAGYMFWWLWASFKLPLIVAASLAILLTMGLSLLTEVAVYRRLRKRKASLSVNLIASIGMMTVIVNLLAMFFGNEAKSLDTISESYQFGDVSITVAQSYQFIVAAVAIPVFLFLLESTRLGLKLRALSSDGTLFETLGYNKQRSYTFAFLTSGLFIGLASCVMAYETDVEPYMGMTALINAMVAMIIGGSGKFWTCVAGGLMLGLLQALAVLVFDTGWQDAVTFVLLLFFLLFRPQGIAGYKQRAV
jgi:branched-chain amino acid transport system permease protein